MPSRLLQPSAARRVDDSRLTPQQQMFVKHLLADPAYNPTKAARSAGYKNPPQAANKLMKDKVVCTAIGIQIRKRQEAPECSEATAIRVLKELAYIGFSNPKQLFDSEGNLLSIADMPEEVARSISSIEVESYTGRGEDAKTTTTTKIKFWSKNNALELIAKHLGMLDERLKVDHAVSGDAANLLTTLLAEVESRRTIIDAQVITDQSTLVE